MLTIRFEGLMCHVGSATEKKHVAIVKAHGHKPRVLIDSSHLIGSVNDLDEELEEGDNVTFDLPTGSAKLAKDDRFKDYVPNLERLLEDVPGNRDLHPEVKIKNPHVHVFAYVTYPEGELTTLEPQRKKLKFMPSSGEEWQQCVADIVEFSARASVIVTMTITRKNGTARPPVKMKPTAVVRFENSTKGNHFHHYRHLTKAAKMATVEAGGDCGPNMKIIPNPECSNSTWP